MRHALVPVGLIAAFAAAAALGVSGETPASPSSPPIEDGSAQAPAVTAEPLAPAPSLSLEPESPGSRTAHGDSLELSGVISPVEQSRVVVFEVDLGSGWVEASRTSTGSDGTFTGSIVATSGGFLRARTLEGDAVSPPILLEVTPKVRTKPVRGLAYGEARVVVRVEPASYAGLVDIVVKRRGKEVARERAEVSNGRLRTRLPLPGIGRFSAVFAFPAWEGLAPTYATARMIARGRALTVGSSGRDVRGLRARLAELHFHVPAASAAFGYELLDSVIAFQKAYGLARTGIVDTATWRALTRSALLRPRHRGPALHIEVDKARQILMVVQGGKVTAVLPVSSGATGNTPEGKHQIRWKALATTTWLGPGILYRTMTFYENSFAIHGWASVPEYAASHGCVRIPIWAADWLYQRSHVGETVYVYS